MPVSLEIYKDGHILLSTFSEPLTLQEVVDKYVEGEALRENSPYAQVHTIVDVSAIQNIPPRALTVFARSPSLTHRTAGYFAIVVGESNTHQFARKFFELVNYERVNFFNTQADALAYLQEIIDAEAD